MVQSNTMVGPGSDAAVVRVKGTKKALAMTLDGPGYRVARNPREGAKMAVAEACRNIVCSGGHPLAATNCLNFGNPEHPEVMWQFSEVVDGMTEACSFFNTPITGGNVSFYNETFGGDIYPTPVLGMVGLIEDLSPRNDVVLSGCRRLDCPCRTGESAGRARSILKTSARFKTLSQPRFATGWSNRLTTSAKAVWPLPSLNAVTRICIGERSALTSMFHRTWKFARICLGRFIPRVMLTTAQPDELRKRAEQMG